MLLRGISDSPSDESACSSLEAHANPRSARESRREATPRFPSDLHTSDVPHTYTQ